MNSVCHLNINVIYKCFMKFDWERRRIIKTNYSVPVDTVVKNQLPIQQRFTQRSVWNRIPQQQRVVIVDEVVLILFFVIFPFSNCICLFWFTWVQMTIWAERLIRPHGSIRTPVLLLSTREANPRCFKLVGMKSHPHLK